MDKAKIRGSITPKNNKLLFARETNEENSMTKPAYNMYTLVTNKNNLLAVWPLNQAK